MTDDNVRAYYDSDPQREWDRLADPYARLEWVCTLALIERYFPAAGHIADVGGGPGRYTLELAQRGYQVTLVEFAPKLLDFAREKLLAAGLAAETHQGNARDLAMLPDASCDAVLLLGPLYHLRTLADRNTALREARRVLKDGGTLLVAYLNPWGVVRIGLHDFPRRYADLDYLQRYLGSWNLDAVNTAFTDAHFAAPPDARTEVEAAGFRIIATAGAESYASGMIEELARLATDNPPAYDSALAYAAQVCEHPAYRESTEHYLIVARTA